MAFLPILYENKIWDGKVRTNWSSWWIGCFKKSLWIY